ncbi:MAG: SDR family oxidoreductase [Candidatus Omnitrophica bacterium]|nr:SDR family oxidoreductase [Candidatus Omnitrophota bacterium]
MALITGASRGIGRAIALRLAGMGAHIVVNYVRNEDAAKETVADIAKLGVKAFPFQANVGNADEADALVKFTLEKFGTVDILVHSAALGAFKPVHRLKINQWDLSLNTNALAFLVLTQKVLPAMEKQQNGSIIAISSLGSHKYIPNYGAVGISKATLENLIRYLGAELAPKGIHVNGISGGLVETDALKFFPEYETFKKEALLKTPAGRIGQPDDLAKVVAFLVSPDSGWIYGQTIIVDGGLSLY